MDPILAYIDAGSGSLIIQALIAAIVAAPFVLRQQISKAYRRLRGRTDAPTQPVPDVDPAE